MPRRNRRRSEAAIEREYLSVYGEPKKRAEEIDAHLRALAADQGVTEEGDYREWLRRYANRILFGDEDADAGSDRR